MWGLLSPYGLRSHDNHVQDTLAAEPDALPAHQSDDLDEESHFIGSLGVTPCRPFSLGCEHLGYRGRMDLLAFLEFIEIRCL